MITVRLWHATGHRGTAQLVQIHIHLLIHPCRFLLFLAWPKLLTYEREPFDYRTRGHRGSSFGLCCGRPTPDFHPGNQQASIITYAFGMYKGHSLCCLASEYHEQPPPRQPANHAMMMLARPSEEHVPRLAVLRFPNGRVSHAQLCTVIYQGVDACSSQQPAPAC